MQNRGTALLIAAIVPRHVELARPNAAPPSAGDFLERDIVAAVFAIGNGPALRHHLGVQIFAAGKAFGHNTAIAIDVALAARDRTTGYLLHERIGCRSAAWPGAADQLAGLVCFRRVDAVQTDATVAKSK